MPPKKDAFADLFQSASTTKNSGVNSRLNKLSLVERQKLEQQQGSTHSLNSSWSNLDILSPQPTRGGNSNSNNNGSQLASARLSNLVSAVGSQSNTPQATVDDSDPFAIFNKTSNEDVNRHTAQPVSTQASAATPQEMSLLDDDFVDLFPQQKKLQQQQQQQQPQKPLEPAEPVPLVKTPRPEGMPARSNAPSTRASRSNASTPRSSNGNSSSSKDHTLAELVDIGFMIEDANDAIAHSGTDLQKCVNYIMNKNTLQSQSRTNSRTRANTENDEETDDPILGKRPDSINLNELGNNLFQKANTFINFSKRKVMENIEQLNNGSVSPFEFGRGSNNGSASPNLPEWMRNQAKYKSQAYEKKYGGEDYGEDEDNINQEEIDRFMQKQREKERHRLRQRFDQKISGGSIGDEEGVGRMGRNSVSSSSRSSMSKEASPAPAKPPRPAAKNSFGGEGKSQVSPEAVAKAPTNKKEQAPPPAEEVDLLGIGAQKSGVIATPSDLRDTSPLNQFIETDYTTHKTRATEAFKTGDYATALESYTTCLSILPPKHELRVVMNSNLALTNKLQGHLKQSLENVEQALLLMQLEECDVKNNNSSSSRGATPQLAGKSVKYWYLKVVIVKAEVLELLEKYELALKTYNLLVQKLGCVDKKVMDGKRRVDRIVNPDSYKPTKPTPKPSTTASTTTSKSSTPKPATTSTKATTTKPNRTTSIATEVELDPLAVDEINNSVTQWAQLKNNDLRQMLINLQVIIPPNSITITPKLLTLTLNDLVLPKQVKLNYMKVISSIHPDKLASQLSKQLKEDKRVQLICNGVFIILNERWEVFRKEENI